jgi:hypothetical protein
MIPRYLATLGIAVVLVGFAASSLKFATRARVLSGAAVDEDVKIDFTIDADRSNTYVVSPVMAEYLRQLIRFRTEGPVHVVSSKVEITPKDVSWTENRQTITSTGAALTAQFRWDTPADSANGARGFIYLDFPEYPGLAGKAPTFHSGGYQKDDAGRWVIREVTTYQSSLPLSLGRFWFALSAGLPFGIVLHTIGWIFVLKGEKRARIAALPLQGTALPQTFYPDPIAEWTSWLLVLGLGSALASLLAGFSIYDGFMSSSLAFVISMIVAGAAAVALVAAYFTGRRLLTVRVESNGIAYARGRGDLQWTNVNWGEVLTITQKSRTYRGSTTYWMELEFNDKRKKLKIQQSIVGYAALRDLLGNVFRR